MDLAILHDLNGFRKHVIDALAEKPVDFLEQVEFIKEQRDNPARWEGAGVLLPLFFLVDENGEQILENMFFS